MAIGKASKGGEPTRAAAGMAHELNNPLTVILGCCHVALESLPQAHPAAAHLKSIRRAAIRCKKLVSELSGLESRRSLA